MYSDVVDFVMMSRASTYSGCTSASALVMHWCAGRSNGEAHTFHISSERLGLVCYRSIIVGGSKVVSLGLDSISPGVELFPPTANDSGSL